jgi:hypothetical protein
MNRLSISFKSLGITLICGILPLSAINGCQKIASKPLRYQIELACLGQVFTLSLSSEEINTIGDKIWKNECSGSVEKLTHWNTNENFASLGIGHFIWYPANKQERFKEAFPRLLEFMHQEGVSLPDWLAKGKGSPWNTRDEFYANFQSSEMQLLRQFLFDTKDLQALFIVKQLENAVSHMLESCPEKDRTRVTSTFFRLANDPKGLFALIDYLNFKGSGTSPKETYKGQGWGLLQVLQGISSNSDNPLPEFVKSAKVLLSLRVRNSPSERQEDKWLKGWINRLDSY